MLERVSREVECFNYANGVGSELAKIGNGKRYGKSEKTRRITKRYEDTRLELLD